MKDSSQWTITISYHGIASQNEFSEPFFSLVMILFTRKSLLRRIWKIREHHDSNRLSWSCGIFLVIPEITKAEFIPGLIPEVVMETRVPSSIPKDHCVFESCPECFRSAQHTDSSNQRAPRQDPKVCACRYRESGNQCRLQWRVS